MILGQHPEALVFTIDRRTLIYAPQHRKVTRWDPARLVAECPMPACEWFITGPDTDAGLFIVTQGRHNHATTAHPEAIHHGGMVLDHTESKVAGLAHLMAESMWMDEEQAVEALRRSAGLS